MIKSYIFWPSRPRPTSYLHFCIKDKNNNIIYDWQCKAAFQESVSDMKFSYKDLVPTRASLQGNQERKSQKNNNKWNTGSVKRRELYLVLTKTPFTF